MKKRPNIILITIDTLRADHLGFMGYEKKVSPNIDELAKESTVFTKAFSNGSETAYSFPSILTSTYPLDYQGPKKIERPRILISEVLKKAGYLTAAFHSNPFLSGFFGYNRGWDFFEDVTPSYDLERFKKYQGKKSRFLSKFKGSFLKLFKKLTAISFPQLYFYFLYLGLKIKKSKDIFKVKAESLNQIAQEFINSVENQPFLIWIHYMDTHDPWISKKRSLHGGPLTYFEIVGRHLGTYINPDSISKKPVKKFLEKNIEKSINLYDQQIEYVDEQIGNFLEFLRKKNIYQNSIICLTADHGEEFMEHGKGGHGGRLYNEVLHVPLLIRIPKGENKIIDKKVSLIDLSPTLCDLIGVKTPASFKGKNLFENKSPLIFHQAVSESYKAMYVDKLNQCQIGCQSDFWKYIIDYSTGQEKLYNLFEDPGEKNNLFQSEVKVLSEMREKIKQFEKENPPLSLLRKEI